MLKSFKLTPIILSVLMVFISSCSDDDDTSSQSDLLIGQWEEVDCSDGQPWMIWTFDADGSFSWASYDTSIIWPTEYGTWKLQNGVIVLYDDDEYYQIKQLDKNRLIVQDIEEGHDGTIHEFIRVQENE